MTNNRITEKSIQWAKQPAKWYGASCILAGVATFIVHRSLRGLPSGRVHWAAGSTAIATLLGSFGLRERLLREPPKKTLKTKIEKQEKIIRRQEDQAAFNAAIRQAGRRSQVPESVEKLMVDGVNKNLNFQSITLRRPADILVVPNFKKRPSDSAKKAVFIAGEVIGSGGQKVPKKAHFFLLEGNVLKRQDDCVWAETKKPNPHLVRLGYELAEGLPAHRHIAAPWYHLCFWEGEIGRSPLSKVIGIEPFYAASLDRIKLNWRQTLRALKHIALGLSLLHSFGVVHKDIKAENIFLDIDENGRLVAKISDFDVFERIGENRSTVDVRHTDGARAYLPPECLDRKPYGLKVDIWAFAVMAYRQTVGLIGGDDAAFQSYVAEQTNTQKHNPIFPEKIATTLDQSGSSERLMESLENGPVVFPDIMPEKRGQEIREMIEQGLSYEIGNRPSAQELVAQLSKK